MLPSYPSRHPKCRALSDDETSMVRPLDAIDRLRLFVKCRKFVMMPPVRLDSRTAATIRGSGVSGSWVGRTLLSRGEDTWPRKPKRLPRRRPRKHLRNAPRRRRLPRRNSFALKQHSRAGTCGSSPFFLEHRTRLRGLSPEETRYAGTAPPVLSRQVRQAAPWPR